MTISKNVGRQEVISASVDINFDDIATGVLAGAIDIPASAYVIGGQVDVVTPFDSGTSDVIVVAVGSETLLTSTTIAAAGSTAFTDTQGIKAVAPDTIDVTWTAVGTAATAGIVRLSVQYVVDGRACFSEG